MDEEYNYRLNLLLGANTEHSAKLKLLAKKHKKRRNSPTSIDEVFTPKNSKTPLLDRFFQKFPVGKRAACQDITNISCPDRNAPRESISQYFKKKKWNIKDKGERSMEVFLNTISDDEKENVLESENDNNTLLDRLIKSDRINQTPQRKRFEESIIRKPYSQRTPLSGFRNINEWEHSCKLKLEEDISIHKQREPSIGLDNTNNYFSQYKFEQRLGKCPDESSRSESSDNSSPKFDYCEKSDRINKLLLGNCQEEIQSTPKTQRIYHNFPTESVFKPTTPTSKRKEENSDRRDKSLLRVGSVKRCQSSSEDVTKIHSGKRTKHTRNLFKHNLRTGNYPSVCQEQQIDFPKANSIKRRLIFEDKEVNDRETFWDYENIPAGKSESFDESEQVRPQQASNFFAQENKNKILEQLFLNAKSDCNMQHQHNKTSENIFKPMFWTDNSPPLSQEQQCNCQKASHRKGLLFEDKEVNTRENIWKFGNYVARKSVPFSESKQDRPKQTCNFLVKENEIGISEQVVLDAKIDILSKTNSRDHQQKLENYLAGKSVPFNELKQDRAQQCSSLFAQENKKKIIEQLVLSAKSDCNNKKKLKDQQPNITSANTLNSLFRSGNSPTLTEEQQCNSQKTTHRKSRLFSEDSQVNESDNIFKFESYVAGTSVPFNVSKQDRPQQTCYVKENEIGTPGQVVLDANIDLSSKTNPRDHQQKFEKYISGKSIPSNEFTQDRTQQCSRLLAQEERVQILEQLVLNSRSDSSNKKCFRDHQPSIPNANIFEPMFRAEYSPTLTEEQQCISQNASHPKSRVFSEDAEINIGSENIQKLENCVAGKSVPSKESKQDRPQKPCNFLVKENVIGIPGQLVLDTNIDFNSKRNPEVHQKRKETSATMFGNNNLVPKTGSDTKPDTSQNHVIENVCNPKTVKTSEHFSISHKVADYPLKSIDAANFLPNADKDDWPPKLEKTAAFFRTLLQDKPVMSEFAISEKEPIQLRNAVNKDLQVDQIGLPNNYGSAAREMVDNAAASQMSRMTQKTLISSEGYETMPNSGNLSNQPSDIIYSDANPFYRIYKDRFMNFSNKLTAITETNNYLSQSNIFPGNQVTSSQESRRRTSWKTYDISENCILYKDNLLKELLAEKSDIMKSLSKNKRKIRTSEEEEVLAKTFIKKYRKDNMRIFKIKRRSKSNSEEYQPPEEQIIDRFTEKVNKDFRDDDSLHYIELESIASPNSYVTADTNLDALPTSHESENLSKNQLLLREGIDELYKNPTLLFSRYSESAPKEPDSSFISVEIRQIIIAILEDYENNGKPHFELPSSRISNCIFKDERHQIKESPVLRRIFFKGLKFNLMLFVLNKIRILLETGTKLTKREIYYQLKSMIKMQYRIDHAICEISRLLKVGPWALNVTAQKGLVYGNLKLMMDDAEIVNCNVPGTSVPKDVTSICEIHSDAYFILVVEKESIFHKLIDEDLPKRLTRPFILITGKGYPDLTTQLFLKKLWMILSIPVFILVDADPDGISIMLNYRFGSITNAHISEHLAIPKARWIGVFPTDISKFDLSERNLSKREIRKVQSMLRMECVYSNQKIKEQLEHLLEHGVKAGIEDVEKTGTYLSNQYLTSKFYTKDII